MVISRKLQTFNTKARKQTKFGREKAKKLKIYSYKGRKNMCGDRIKQARQKQRISQSDLAARLQVEGVTMERDSVSRIEIGTRFVADYELMVIARVLNVPLSWLMGQD